MTRKTSVKPLQKNLWARGRTGNVVCQCGAGYGSELDGLCTNCRGMSAWEAKAIAAKLGGPQNRGSQTQSQPKQAQQYGHAIAAKTALREAQERSEKIAKLAVPVKFK